MESIPCLYSSVLSTNTLSMSHHGDFSTMVSSVSSRPIPSGSRRKVTRSWPRNWLRSWPRNNTFYTTKRQCPRPAIPCSSLSSNTVLFPLLSSWANPSSYHYSDDPMNLTFKPRTSLQALGGSPSNPLLKSNRSLYLPLSLLSSQSSFIHRTFYSINNFTHHFHSYFVFYSRMFLEYQRKYNYFIDLGCKNPILTNQLGCCAERELACLKRHFA